MLPELLEVGSLEVPGLLKDGGSEVLMACEERNQDRSE